MKGKGKLLVALAIVVGWWVRYRSGKTERDWQKSTRG